jgi:16S rRNA (cytidine1402-2'-O)-methyltransferase
MFEEVRRGPANEVLAYYQEHEPRGEITLVIGGAAAQADDEAWTDEMVIQALQTRLDAGEPRKQAAKSVAQQAGRDSRDVYNLSLTL